MPNYVPTFLHIYRKQHFVYICCSPSRQAIKDDAVNRKIEIELVMVLEAQNRKQKQSNRIISYSTDYANDVLGASERVGGWFDKMYMPRICFCFTFQNDVTVWHLFMGYFN